MKENKIKEYLNEKNININSILKYLKEEKGIIIDLIKGNDEIELYCCLDTYTNLLRESKNHPLCFLQFRDKNFKL